MIRLGHIDYSNCIPVHALLLDEPRAGLVLVRDVPARLNRALAAGEIDVAPCSSIEYARHAGEYRILPCHAIGSSGPVRSILLESTVAPEQLDGRTVAVPTASASSVVLLRALLELRLGVRPHLAWYEQAAGVDPVADGAAAVLRIGDIALRRGADALQRAADQRMVLDLGAEWTAWTGLPFAYAVWQIRRDVDAAGVQLVVQLLRESRAYFMRHATPLAARYAAGFGLSPELLSRYWASLSFELDGAMQRGLLHFYRLAAELGEAPPTEQLDIIRPG
jgi:chorismate dehydratase